MHAMWNDTCVVITLHVITMRSPHDRLLYINRSTQDQSCTVHINGIATTIEPDTGADTNIMDEGQFRNLQRKAPEIEFRRSRVKLKALIQDLPVKGECFVTIENQTRIAQAKIVIIKGMMDSIPLIGRPTLEDLGMIKIDETGGLKEPNNNRSQEIAKIKKVQGNQGNLDKILHWYSTRFQGIGKATREGQEIQIHLPMIKDAVPVAQKPRRVPYHLMEPLQKRSLISAPDQPETAPARQPTVPPAAPMQVRKPTQTAAEQQTTAEQTRPVMRKSQRQTRSIFEGKLKDFSK